jgi:hypothetical protein
MIPFRSRRRHALAQAGRSRKRHGSVRQRTHRAWHSATLECDAALAAPDFKNRPTECGEIESTYPRLTASSASSPCVQWVIARPLSVGGSQANAIIVHICSAVKVGGVPERGASDKRSATLPSVLAVHRRRHACTVERPTLSSAAVSRTPSPSAASRTIRARKEICCGHVRCRISDCKSCRSRSVTGTGAA